MGIPKIIHYCWFGKGSPGSLVEMCVSSWKEKLPDYEIMIWNEDSFDIDSVKFVKEAYEAKKWAFVSDYVRIYALYNYGGVYMDTDVEVIKDFTPLLENESLLSSFLEGRLVSGNFFAAEKEHPFIKKILDYYSDKSFINSDGSFNDCMNTLIYTKILMEAYGLKFGAAEFKGNGIHLLPMQYFAPYRKNILGNGKNKYSHRNYKITENTYTIHHDMGSWGRNSALRKLIKGSIRLILPQNRYENLKQKKFRTALKGITYYEN